MSTYLDFPDDVDYHDNNGFSYLHSDGVFDARHDAGETDSAVYEVASNETLNAFARRHNLNAESISFLDAVHPEVQQEVVEQFRSNEKGAVRNRIFQSFCRSRVMKFFVQQWRLNATASDLLHNASPYDQLILMGRFDPPNADIDVNRLFIAFANRRIQTVRPIRVQHVGTGPTTRQHGSVQHVNTGPTTRQHVSVQQVSTGPTTRQQGSVQHVNTGPTTRQHVSVQQVSTWPTTRQHGSVQHVNTEPTTRQHVSVQQVSTGPTTRQHGSVQHVNTGSTTRQHVSVQQVSTGPTTRQHVSVQHVSTGPTTRQHGSVQHVSTGQTTRQHGSVQHVNTGPTTRQYGSVQHASTGPTTRQHGSVHVSTGPTTRQHGSVQHTSTGRQHVSTPNTSACQRVRVSTGPSVSHASGATTHSAPTIASFCRKWELDNVSRAALEKVSPEVASKLMTDFAPTKVDPVTVNSKFLGFIKSRVPPSLSKQESVKDNIQTFVRDWDLPRESVTTLEQLPTGIRTSVISEFNPKPETENMANNFLSFVESRKKENPSHFVRRFGLDAQSQRVLIGLDRSVRQEVMANFAPEELREIDGGDMNPLFMAYAASMQRIWRKPGAEAPIERQDSRYEKIERRDSRYEKIETSAMVEVDKSATVEATSGKNCEATSAAAEVDKFCSKFGLDRECQDRLSRLNSHVRAAVMSEFNPRNRSNLRTLFLKFLRSREMTIEAPLEQNVESFCSKWNLDDMCQRRLYSLPSELQASVMKDFGPKDDTIAICPLFLSFVRSREITADTVAPRSNTARWSSMENFCNAWGLDDDCLHRLCQLSSDMKQYVMDEFYPQCGGNVSAQFMAFVRLQEKFPMRTSAPDRGVEAHPRSACGRKLDCDQVNVLSKFIKKHGLDVHCAKSLEDLKPDDQNLAMAHFDPSYREDINTQFVKFLWAKNLKRSSVDKRVAEERRVKPRH